MNDISLSLEEKTKRKKEKRAKYRLKNKEKISQYNRSHHAKNRIELNEKSKKWKINNGEAISAYNTDYYSKNQDIINGKYKDYYLANTECFAQKAKERREKNRSKYSEIKHAYDALPENKERVRNRNKSNWSSYLISSAKAGARRRNIEFTITENDFLNPHGRKCPIFNTEFVIGRGHIHDHSATLDRIDNSKGYVPGNVWVISSLANRIKHSSSLSQIRRLGIAVLEIEKRLPHHIIDVDLSTKSRRQRMIRFRRSGNNGFYPFEISWYHLSLSENCPCIGLKIDYESISHNWKCRPTIDRIDNSKGYVPGNVWIISALANAMKTSATGAQIIRVADALNVISSDGGDIV